VNTGAAGARDIVVEALAFSAGETQGEELAAFFSRTDADRVAVAQLPRLGAADLTHEVLMPRGALREYAAQGRRLFVPLLAFNVSYGWSGGRGRTSAAFLVGQERAGSEKLAPLPLDSGATRLTGLGVRRLDEQVRR
jgi:hypothetical protein